MKTKYFKYLIILISLPFLYYLTSIVVNTLYIRYLEKNNLPIIDKYFTEHFLECSFDSKIKEMNYNCIYNAETLAWKKYYTPNVLEVSKLLCERGLDFACANYDFRASNYSLAKRSIGIADKYKSFSLCLGANLDTVYSCGITQLMAEVNHSNDLFIISSQSPCMARGKLSCNDFIKNNYILSESDLKNLLNKNECLEKISSYNNQSYCKILKAQYALSLYIKKSLLIKQKDNEKLIYEISQSKECLNAGQEYCFNALKWPRRTLEALIKENQESKVNWHFFENVGVDFYSAMLIMFYIPQDDYKYHTKSTSLNFFKDLYSNNIQSLETGCLNGEYHNCGRIYNNKSQMMANISKLHSFCEKGDFESCQVEKLLGYDKELSLVYPLEINKDSAITAFQNLYFNSNGFLMSKYLKDHEEGNLIILSVCTLILFIFIFILLYYSSEIFKYIKSKIIEDYKLKITEASHNKDKKKEE